MTSPGRPSVVDELIAESELTPRRRATRELLSAHPLAVLLTVVQPGTQIPVHRHPDSSELLIVLDGAVDVIRMGPDGDRENVTTVEHDGASIIAIPSGEYHTLVTRRPNTVLLEVFTHHTTMVRPKEYLQLPRR